jgi:ribosomal protein S18 acetylase RimI-like enzyme
VAAPPPFELEPRKLSLSDSPWVEIFDSGDDWWSVEVTNHLRSFAHAQQLAGYNETTLFSRRGEQEIVGFATFSSDRLKIPQVQSAFPEFGVPPGIATAFVPAWIIAFFGVHRDSQGQTFGEEMHASLLLRMEASPGSPRFVYLQCWEENAGAMRFWQRLGYREFHRTSPLRPDRSGSATLVRMIYDRQRSPSAQQLA